MKSDDTTNTLSIMIADSHSLFREKIKEVLTNNKKNIKVVAEVDTESNIEAIIQEKRPDLLILDIAFLRGSGKELLKSLKTKYENLKIVILNDDANPEYAKFSYFLGAHGVCVKDRIVFDLRNIVKSLFKEVGFKKRGNE